MVFSRHAGHWSACGTDCFCITCFGFLPACPPSPYLCLLKCLNINPRVFLLCSLYSLPCPTGDGGSEQVAVWHWSEFTHNSPLSHLVWGNTAEQMFEKRKRTIQIFLKADFAIKQSKVKRSSWEILFWGIMYQDKHHKIAAFWVYRGPEACRTLNEKNTNNVWGNLSCYRNSWYRVYSSFYLIGMAADQG